MEIIDAAKGEEYPPGTVDVKFLDNITMLLNKPTLDWAVSIEQWH